jgi:extracellular factor (EF) 3-hydroxypalmitic acid methyl ester biosynthesis protein
LLEPIEQLQAMARRGGPEPEEYELVDLWFRDLAGAVADGRLSVEQLHEVAFSLGDAFSLETTQGFVLRQPHGYAGDFEVIDRIYQKRVSSRPDLANWDRFAHSRPSNQAVRNRKDYFIGLLNDASAALGPRETLSVLDVGSGPARDVNDFFDVHPDRAVEFTCLDQEPKAIEYAQQVCARHLDRIEFVHSNVLRYSTASRYQLIWCAGLFDYLTDRAFVFLLRRLLGLVRPSGEVVVGNFAPTNPDQAYMAFGGWHLNHRTEEELIALAVQTGVYSANIVVESEEAGINLFLRISVPESCGRAAQQALRADNTPHDR